MYEKRLRIQTYKEQGRCDIFPHDGPPDSWSLAQHHLNVLEEVLDAVHIVDGDAFKQTDDQEGVGGSVVVDKLYHIHASLERTKP